MKECSQVFCVGFTPLSQGLMFDLSFPVFHYKSLSFNQLYAEFCFGLKKRGNSQGLKIMGATEKHKSV